MFGGGVHIRCRSPGWVDLRGTTRCGEAHARSRGVFDWYSASVASKSSIVRRSASRFDSAMALLVVRAWFAPEHVAVPRTAPRCQVVMAFPLLEVLVSDHDVLQMAPRAERANRAVVGRLGGHHPAVQRKNTQAHRSIVAEGGRREQYDRLRRRGLKTTSAVRGTTIASPYPRGFRRRDSWRAAIPARLLLTPRVTSRFNRRGDIGVILGRIQ